MYASTSWSDSATKGAGTLALVGALALVGFGLGFVLIQRLSGTSHEVLKFLVAMSVLGTWIAGAVALWCLIYAPFRLLDWRHKVASGSVTIQYQTGRNVVYGPGERFSSWTCPYVTIVGGDLQFSLKFVGEDSFVRKLTAVLSVIPDPGNARLASLDRDVALQGSKPLVEPLKAALTQLTTALTEGCVVDRPWYELGDEAIVAATELLARPICKSAGFGVSMATVAISYS